MPLPELLHFHGDWNRYEEELYEHYLSTLSRHPLHFRGLPIRLRFHPPTKGKGYGFWHVISEGKVEDERLPDFRRCERVPWIAWMIQHAEDEPSISWWQNERREGRNYVLWIESEAFAVILAIRPTYLLLKTAYCVKQHRAGDFRKERAICSSRPNP